LRKSNGGDQPKQVQEREKVRAETELYAPIKAWLQERGYTVRGEVRGCDVAAVRDGEEWPLVVELKRRFNLSLVLQAVERLQSTPNVYIAAERTAGRGGFPLGEIRRLCRMLGIGLLTVKLYKRKPALVELHCEPGEGKGGAASPTPRAPGRRTARLLTEFHERSGDYNAGGTTGRKLVTAYREKALRIAEALREGGQLAPRHVRERTGCAKAGAILRSNVYGWYRNVSRGLYELTPAGAEALSEFSEVITAARNETATS
jgi:hypothetical protein